MIIFNNRLSPKQLKFCHEYVFTGNATVAAINAGDSEKTARFNKNPIKGFKFYIVEKTRAA